jgi:glycosyltransferase involved in cell wall biosynthesis
MRTGQKKYEVFNKVHVHRIPVKWPFATPVGRITAKPFWLMLILWLWFAMLASLKLSNLRAMKFQVVHVHNMPDFLVFSALIPKAMGAKVILEIQDVSPELMAVKAKGIARKLAVVLATWQERISTAFCDHVLTVGWPFEECLLKRGVPHEKMSSILNSADPSVFSDEKRTEPFLGMATPQRPLIITYHGTCAVRNGIDIAIQAFALARKRAPHIRLHIRGQGECMPHLIDLAEQLEVSDQVSFSPYGDLESVPDFVSSGDVGIIPYRSDGFMDLVLPTKAYELALMRRPIIASDMVAIRSMFRPDSIVYCQPSNPESFADAIIDLYYHPQRRGELVDRAERDNLKFEWSIMADRYCNLLASLARHTAL